LFPISSKKENKHRIYFILLCFLGRQTELILQRLIENISNLIPLKLAQISLVKLFLQSFKFDREEILPRKLGNGPTKLQLIQERFLNSKLSSLPKKSLQMEVLFLKRASRLSPVKGTPISCIHNVRENRKKNKENKKPSLQKRRVRLHREKSRK
jgi:hypothetical protein